MFEFCDRELFPETVLTATSTATANTTNNNTNDLSIIFDSQDEIDNDIAASIDFSPSPAFSVPQFVTNQQDQLDLLSLQPQIQLSDVVVDGLSQYPADPISRLMGPPLPSVFEEDCLSSVPSYVPLNPPSPSGSFLGPAMGTYMASGSLTAALPADNSGFVAGSSFMGGPELQPQDLEFQGDNGGIFFPDSIQRMFNHEDLQALSGENTTQLVGGVGSSVPLATEISSLEDSSFKVGKLSVEQRKEKIHRYMKKRSERNFSKKIKYACRKTLADSRPRVRGRFAKNDDFEEPHRNVCSNHEEDDDDEVGVKEEDDMVDSSDIFAHISGVNSFKCNYSPQSWIG
ncbi:two-component response regulator-like APRR7 [Tripterygium wilfordii]|uniref:Two-component response regulator-like APRR7 n=2 Tax=Tripterygium wilfordii TaxID=458696 RepID=A0A7J7CRI0_TRIWF|nr:two-component response regulator-like APRR7 [Tripterygium wilfordii]